MKNVTLPGWVWPVLFMVGQQLIDYYTALDTVGASAVVIVLTALLKLLELYVKKPSPERVDLADVTASRTRTLSLADKDNTLLVKRKRTARDVWIEWVAG